MSSKKQESPSKRQELREKRQKRAKQQRQQNADDTGAGAQHERLLRVPRTVDGHVSLYGLLVWYEER